MNDIQKFLDLQSKKVQKNLTIVTPQDLGRDYFLHIAKVSERYYYPRIGTKQATSEDRTVPRITVSPFLAGCMIGFAALDHMFTEPEFNDTELDITKIEFDFALKPTKHLVFDQKFTDEHWLVTYDKETVRYQPKKIGKMFASTVTYKRSDKSQLFSIIEVFIHIKTDDVVTLDHFDNIEISKGYYKCLIHMQEEKITNLTTITKSEYEESHGDSVATESTKPLYAAW